VKILLQPGTLNLPYRSLIGVKKTCVRVVASAPKGGQHFARVRLPRKTNTGDNRPEFDISHPVSIKDAEVTTDIKLTFQKKVWVGFD
jgi:hypothetical protein